MIGFTAFLVKQVAYHWNFRKINKLKKMVKKSKFSNYIFFLTAPVESIGNGLYKFVEIVICFK